MRVCGGTRTALVPMLAVAVLGMLAFAGCGDDSSEGAVPEPSAPLTVSAASSLADAFEVYGATLDPRPRFSFAGSDEMTAQIRSGAPVDVFASANTTYPDELYEQGLVEEPVVFVRNELVIAVSSGSSIRSLDELATGDYDIVIGAEGVPAGDYAREVLGRLATTEREAILGSVRSEEPEVKGIVGKLAAGAADAGFVYATDVEAAGGEIVAVDLPAELEPEVAYGIAVVREASDPAAARAFIDGLLRGAGAQALLEAGFLPPHGPGGGD